MKQLWCGSCTKAQME